MLSEAEVMYPPQPSLKNREGVELYKLKRLQFCLLKSASPKFRGGTDGRRGNICSKITILLVIPDTHII